MSSTMNQQGRFLVSPIVLLERFLLCGSLSNRIDFNRPFAEIPTDVKKAVITIFEEFPEDAFRSLLRVVDGRLAARVPPVLFALACALRNETTRQRAEQLHPKAVRTGTDALVLAEYLKSISGGGRSFRRQASLFYKGLENRTEDEAVLQFIKYRNRAGWTHRDLLRVCHHKPSAGLQEVFSFASGKGYTGNNKLMAGFLGAQERGEDLDADDAVSLIRSSGIPWEALPSHVLRSKQVWEELLPNLGFTALVRNLGRMQSLGIDLSPYAGRLTNPRHMHPVQMLSAYNVYRSGRGVMGGLVWAPNSTVTEALEAGFYASFETLEKSDVPVVFGLDVSGSMGNASPVAGLNCREVSAAMVMAALRQHPFELLGFASSPVEIPVEKHWTLGMLVDYVSRMRFGNTRCAAPMEYALQKSLPGVGLFAIFTDNESNSGPAPVDSLRTYRERHNPNACFAAVAIQGNAQSISDADDWGSMDICGFDSSVPSLLTDLSEREEI